MHCLGPREPPRRMRCSECRYSRRPCALLQDALEQSKAKLVAVVQASMPQGTRHAWAQQLRLLGSSVGRPS